MALCLLQRLSIGMTLNCSDGLRLRTFDYTDSARCFGYTTDMFRCMVLLLFVVCWVWCSVLLDRCTTECVLLISRVFVGAIPMFERECLNSATLNLVLKFDIRPMSVGADMCNPVVVCEKSFSLVVVDTVLSC